MCIPLIFFIFYTLFCSLSQNELGRQDVPFVVMDHISLIPAWWSPNIQYLKWGSCSKMMGNPDVGITAPFHKSDTN